VRREAEDGSARALVESWDGGLLVVGGPGSGKTSVVVEAAVRATRDRQRPDPLVVTWSRTAASDLRNRITLALGRTVAQPAVGTVHAFCRTLLDRFADGPPRRLLTAPEQEFRVREILRGRGAGAWPADLGSAVGTHGFARQVRAAIARARQLGLDPEDLERFGRRDALPAWEALGRFFDEYLDVLDAEGVLDYAELVHRCRILLTEPDVLAQVRADVGAVVVDEYTELDPAQIGLLRALVPVGGLILATGDPGQAANSFRGAHPRAIAEFPELFHSADAGPARIALLEGSHRFSRTVAGAVEQLRRRLPVVAGAANGPVEPRRSAPAGSVRALVAAGEADQARVIAEAVRSARLEHGLAYGDIAVLVRSGRHQIAPIVRALSNAGVPVEVAGDEIPLAQAPAVQPLLLALAVLARDSIAPDEAVRLVTSPLAGLDAVAVRGLVRLWRTRVGDHGAGALTTADVLAAALTHPEWLDGLPPSGPIDRIGDLVSRLARCRALMVAGEPVDRVLWELWDGGRWRERLTADAARGGGPGRRADRDLDALCALFEAAAEADRRPGVGGIRMFLAEVSAQQIPADREREARVRGRGVQVMTVHRAKGRQWPMVVVAGVQEGVWPAAHRRQAVIQPDRLTRDGLGGGTTHREALADERRLFYLACSRARDHLMVTATAGTDGEGDPPSRFLAELGVDVDTATGPARPLTLPDLVAHLRRCSVDAGATPQLREAAAVRLARLADLTDGRGQPLARSADPSSWWGLRELSASPAPVTGPIRLSPSQVNSLLTCPRRYFLQRHAEGEGPPSLAIGIGHLIHLLVEQAGADQLTEGEIPGVLDRLWDRVPFEAAWVSAGERAAVTAAVVRYFAWQRSRTGLEVVGLEQPFEFSVEVAGRQVTVAGAVDRLERTPAGELQVIDFKTARSLPTRAEVESMDQLGIYQLAVESGGLGGASSARCAGAAAVFLRHGDAADLPREVRQPSLAERPDRGDAAEQGYPTWVHQRIAAAAETLAVGRFEALPGGHCRPCVFATSCPAVSAGKQVL